MNDSNGPARLQKLWNYCNVLRDDGMSYGDYVEQLTYLLFLKMDDEQRSLRPNYGREGVTKPQSPRRLPLGQSRPARTASSWRQHYRTLLRRVGARVSA